MSALELVTPVATFRAYLNISTSFLQRDLTYGLAHNLDERINAIWTSGTVFYEAHDLSLVLDRVEYDWLYAIVDTRTCFISLYANRKGEYPYVLTMSDAPCKKLKAQIGETLLAHAVGHINVMQAASVTHLFGNVRKQIADMQATLQVCLRELESRED